MRVERDRKTDVPVGLERKLADNFLARHPRDIAGKATGPLFP